MNLGSVRNSVDPQSSLRTAELEVVIYRSNLLLSSSDVSRVKVTRTNPETGEQFTMEYNLEETEYPDDLWLRDGDIIEVPDKE